MFSWHVKKEGFCAASPKIVWDIYTKLEKLSEWNDSVEWCTLSGPVAVGTKGQIKMKDRPSVDFIIDVVENERLYRDKTKIFGATFTFSHQLIPMHHGVQIINTFKVCGILAPILKIFMKKQLENSMQKALENLIKKAEQ